MSEELYTDEAFPLEEASQESPTPTEAEVSPSSEVQEDRYGHPISTEEEAKTEEVSSEAPSPTASQETPPEEDDISVMRQRLDEALGKLASISSANLGSAGKEASSAQPAIEDFKLPEPGQITTVDFIGTEDHVSILEDRAKFNELLNKVATVAFKAAQASSTNYILRQIPEVVEKTAKQQLTIENTTRDFYSANQDLVPYKNAVAMAAMQLYQEHPEMSLPELLRSAAERTRSVLRLRSDGQRRRVPAQPAGGVGGGVDRVSPSSGLSQQEQQILDLITF